MPVVSSTAVTLRIMGDDLEPSRITELLGCQPDDSCRKGEVLSSSMAKIPARQGMWHVAAKESKPGNIVAQVNSLLARMTDDLQVWRDLADRYKVELFCGLFLANAHEGISLDTLTISRLAARGISLDFAIYFVGDEEEG